MRHSFVTASIAATDLTHGFRTAFDVLTALAVVGLVIAIRFVAPVQRPAAVVPATGSDSFESLEEAA